MDQLFTSRKVFLAKSTIPGAGRGIFAACDLHKDELIECCPVIEIPPAQVSYLQETELSNYYFQWGEDQRELAVCFGFGSLYNHSYEPNATYQKNYEGKVISFVTIKEIKKGEEITVNYNHGNPDDKSTLWIKSIPPYEPPQ